MSCYVDHNVSMPAQDVWRVEITNREEIGDVWHALESMVNTLLVFIHLEYGINISSLTGSIDPRQYQCSPGILWKTAA